MRESRRLHGNVFSFLENFVFVMINGNGGVISEMVGLLNFLCA